MSSKAHNKHGQTVVWHNPYGGRQEKRNVTVYNIHRSMTGNLAGYVELEKDTSLDYVVQSVMFPNVWVLVNDSK